MVVERAQTAEGINLRKRPQKSFIHKNKRNDYQHASQEVFSPSILHTETGATV